VHDVTRPFSIVGVADVRVNAVRVGSRSVEVND
jgi:hypothetical protein